MIDSVTTFLIAWQPEVLIGLGLTIGLYGGLLGLGGGWLVVPTLNILGYPVVTAVGTSLAQMVGTSAVAAYQHSRLKNLHVCLGLSLVLPQLGGIYLGNRLLLQLDALGASETAIRYAYMIILSSIGLSSLSEALRSIRSESALDNRQSRVRLPQVGPSLQVDECEVPIYLIAILGVMTGILSAILGIGGGIILVPALYHFVGVATLTAVASTRISMMFAAGVAAVWYWNQGFVDVDATLYILAGSVVGSYFGATFANSTRGPLLRLLFGIVLLVTLVATALRQYEMIFAAQLVLILAVPCMTVLIVTVALKARKVLKKHTV